MYKPPIFATNYMVFLALFFLSSKHFEQLPSSTDE